MAILAQNAMKPHFSVLPYLFCYGFIVILILCMSCSKSNEDYPQLMIWAWERKEDLRFIDTKKVGVAYLVLTIQIKNSKIIRRPRLNYLLLPENTYTIPVIRIEYYDQNSKKEIPNLQEYIINEIVNTIKKTQTNRIQIDFEVTESRRKFYIALIQKLNVKVKHSIEVSVTGLVSWCYEDNWIHEMDVSEVVPMIFDLGKERNIFLGKLNRGDFFTEELCTKSVGVSNFQDLPSLPRNVRKFLFSNQAWTKENFEKIVSKINRNPLKYQILH